MNNPTYLNRYRRSLLVKHRELLTANGGRLRLSPAGGLPGTDFMEQALAESEATIDAHLSQARSRQRRAIEKALLRIQKGDYGVCAACGNTITRARLRAVPWTDLCRDCREQDDGEF